MLSLPDTHNGEPAEEYHTPPENSSAVPSSDESAGAAGASAERVVDLARGDEADVLQDVEFGKGGEVDELIVLERKLEKTRALGRKEGSPGSLTSKLRIELGLPDSCLDLEGGNVPDFGVFDCGFDSWSSKGKNLLDGCLQEYLAKKLKKAERKLGIVIGNEHSDASGAGLMKVDREIREPRILKGYDTPEKTREDKVTGASAGKSDGRLKMITIDGEIGGTLVDNSVKRLKSLKSSGSRDMVKDVANGNSEAVDLDGGWKESPVKRMKIFDVNFQVRTTSSDVGIVKEKIMELLKSMEKLNPQEGIAEGSSKQRKSFKNSNCEDTMRIINLEVSENDGSVLDRDLANNACFGERFGGNERRMNLAQKSIQEIEKFRCRAKSFQPHDKGKRKCLHEGSAMANGEVDDLELCYNLARKISKSREGPQEAENVVLATSISDAARSPKDMVPDLLKVMKMITGARVDTNERTECVVDVAKLHGLKIPRPDWWPEGDFQL